MALQIRRGEEAQRASLVPLEGELLYVTDTHLLYVGDGTQAGGHPVGISGGDVTGPFSSSNNAVALYNGITGKELQNSNVFIDNSGTITAPKVSSSIPFYYENKTAFPAAANVSGAVAYASSENKMYYANETRWVEILQTIKQDPAPQLGGSLDMQNNAIFTSTTNGDITLLPNGTGAVNISNGNLRLNGDIVKSGTLTVSANQINLPSRVSIQENTFPVNDTLLSSTVLFTQTHTTAQSIPITFKRSRGNSFGLSTVANSDELGSLRFDGYSSSYINGGKIAAVVDGSPGASSMPTKFQFSTHNGSAVAVRAELSSGGMLKVDQINSLTTSQLTFNTALKLAVKSITGLTSGNVTLTAADITGNILTCSPSADRDLTLPDATITSLIGIFAIIRNTSGSFAVTVKNSDGSTLTTVNASGVRAIYNDGASWFSY
jgi:hypothetical protein